MKGILFVSAFSPSRRTAGQHYTLSLLRDLSKNFLVDLICFRDPTEPVFQTISPFIRLLFSLISNHARRVCGASLFPFLHPLFTSRCSPRLAWFLLRHSHEYDWIYFDFPQVFLYSLLVPPSTRCILMAHDVFFQKYGRSRNLFIRFSSLLARLTEGFLLRSGKSGHHVFTFSEKDRKFLHDTYRVPSEVVDFFLPDSIMNLSMEECVPRQKIVMLGAWVRPENQRSLDWFLREVFVHAPPTLELCVLGGEVPSRLRDMHRDPRIRWMGFSENPYPELASSLALIAPLSEGAGVKLKVIESLACGTPVIGTTIAFEGIECQDQRFVHLCSAPGEYLVSLKRASQVSSLERWDFHRNFIAHYPKRRLIDFLQGQERG